MVEILDVLVDIKVGDAALDHFPSIIGVASEVVAHRRFLVSIRTIPLLSSGLLGGMRVVRHTNRVHLLPVTLVPCLRVELGIHSNRCDSSVVPRCIELILLKPQQ